MKPQNSEIEQELLSHGANLVGFADISNLPAEITDGFPRAVSIAAALDSAIISGILKGPTREYFEEYKRLNNMLNKLCERTVQMLNNAGRKAKAITTTTDKFDSATLSTPFQHKTTATLAGLGWIGKSALLITKQYGPAIRLATVLTDAELKVGKPVNGSLCGNCQKCKENCPAGAVTGKNWNIGDERESIYNAFTCRQTARKLAKKQGIEATICGICINVCPWTQKYISCMNRAHDI
jgi:epoxyqueuosine reductase